MRECVLNNSVGGALNQRTQNVIRGMLLLRMYGVFKNRVSMET